MTNRDRVALRHMLDHAREAIGMIRDKSRTDLDTNRMLNLALVRLVEVVGEAAVTDLPLLINQLERIMAQESG